MSKAIRLSEDMVGKKVRCIKKRDNFHPSVGTVGTIVKYYKEDDDMNYQVQWPKNSIPYDDSQSLTWAGESRTWVYNDSIELVEDEQETPVTNEEIWEMLRPKLEKNEVKPCSHHYMFGAVYNKDDVINAVSVAYKSGYLRAKKGRPFKFGEKKNKKQGGHWVPVDPNNLPEEGTRVRYARNIDDGELFSEWTGIQIGEETVVNRIHGEFWVADIHNVNKGYPLCSFIHPERFDMWVEDDE